MQLPISLNHPSNPGFVLDDPYLEIAWHPVAGPPPSPSCERSPAASDDRAELHLDWANLG